MIVAGIGSRKGASEREVLEAINAALATQHLDLAALSALATGGVKRAEKAISDAAQRLGLPLHIVEDGALQSTADRCLTVSERSLAWSGSPSLSEAAALATAGDGARLLGARLVHGSVTCALAQSGAQP